MEGSVRAWAELVEVGSTDSTSTAIKEQLPELKFSEEEDRWIQWATNTAASMKAAVSPVSPLPVLPPSLPPRPAPITQEPSETSFIFRQIQHLPKHRVLSRHVHHPRSRTNLSVYLKVQQPRSTRVHLLAPVSRTGIKVSLASRQLKRRLRAQRARGLQEN
jgi:hypothetical protein